MLKTRHRTPFEACLKQAWELVDGPFYPFIDQLDDESITDILRKVKLEYDDYVAGYIPVSEQEGRRWANKARAFMKRWSYYVDARDKCHYQSLRKEKA